MGQRSSTASVNTGATPTLQGTSTQQQVENPSNQQSSSTNRHRHRHRNVSQSNSSQSVANLSPRSRFRHEMSRRGYATNSDIFFRLFQLQSPGQSSSSSSSSNQNTRALNSDLSSDDDESNWNHNLSSLANSLPFFFGMRDLKCFVCNKMIPADDVEAHIMMCLTKPRLTYNEDVLADDKGECVICFEELEKGQTIARLPCLCIYHKPCIDEWLTRSQSCPGHPPD